jgi:hypothetical protein
MLRTLLTVFVVLMLTTSGVAARPEPIRQWTDDTGTFQVKATLAEISESGETVKLRLEDGKFATVPLDRLSESDRRYVTSRSRRKNSASATPASDQPSAISKHKTAPTTRLFGIDWHPSVDQAREAARGTSSPSDDRPVMCFRVLGDLNGFM